MRFRFLDSASASAYAIRCASSCSASNRSSSAFYYAAIRSASSSSSSYCEILFAKRYLRAGKSAGFAILVPDSRL